MVEVLPLQQHPQLEVLAQPAALPHRRRPAAVLPEQPVELAAKHRIAPRPPEGNLELFTGRHERLGYEAATVVAEAPRDRGLAHHLADDRELLECRSGLNTPPASRTGRSSSESKGSGSAAFAACTKALIFIGILLPGRRLDAARHIDAPRVHGPDGLRHVAGVQTAGEYEPPAPRGALRQPPVEDLARARRRSVEEDDVRPVLLRPGEALVAGDEGLDHDRDPHRDVAAVLPALVAVQLHGFQLRLVHHLDHSLRPLVLEQARP